MALLCKPNPEPVSFSIFRDIFFQTQVLKRTSNLGAGFLQLGLQVSDETLVGIFAKNRPEVSVSTPFLITGSDNACRSLISPSSGSSSSMHVSVACHVHALVMTRARVCVAPTGYCYSMGIVPIYDTLGQDACRHICQQADLRVCVCDTAEKATILLGLASVGNTTLRHVVICDEISPECQQLADQVGIGVHLLADVERMGADHPAPHVVILAYGRVAVIFST